MVIAALARYAFEPEAIVSDPIHPGKNGIAQIRSRDIGQYFPTFTGKRERVVIVGMGGTQREYFQSGVV